MYLISVTTGNKGYRVDGKAPMRTGIQPHSQSRWTLNLPFGSLSPTSHHCYTPQESSTASGPSPLSAFFLLNRQYPIEPKGCASHVFTFLTNLLFCMSLCATNSSLLPSRPECRFCNPPHRLSTVASSMQPTRSQPPRAPERCGEVSTQ